MQVLQNNILVYFLLGHIIEILTGFKTQVLQGGAEVLYR